MIDSIRIKTMRLQLQDCDSGVQHKATHTHTHVFLCETFQCAGVARGRREKCPGAVGMSGRIKARSWRSETICSFVWAAAGAPAGRPFITPTHPVNFTSAVFANLDGGANGLVARFPAFKYLL